MPTRHREEANNRLKQWFYRSPTWWTNEFTKATNKIWVMPYGSIGNSKTAASLRDASSWRGQKIPSLPRTLYWLYNLRRRCYDSCKFMRLPETYELFTSMLSLVTLITLTISLLFWFWSCHCLHWLSSSFFGITKKNWLQQKVIELLVHMGYKKYDLWTTQHSKNRWIEAILQLSTISSHISIPSWIR